jgi:hypothetical protein
MAVVGVISRRQVRMKRTSDGCGSGGCERDVILQSKQAKNGLPERYYALFSASGHCGVRW